MTPMRPEPAVSRRLSLRRSGILWLWVCVSLCLLWGGRLSAQGEASEVIRQQDEEEARRKLLRASDALDQIEGTVEGHTRELQQLQQELSRMREELRQLRERLAQASAASPEAERPKPGGKTPPVKASSPGSAAADSGSHAKVVTGYYYKVQAGDTLAAIAEAYQQSGVSVTADQIRAANGLSGKQKLHPGQKLFIPKGLQKKRGPTDRRSTPSSSGN